MAEIKRVKQDSRRGDETRPDAAHVIGRLVAVFVVCALFVLLICVWAGVIFSENITRGKHLPLVKLNPAEGIILSCEIVFVIIVALWIFDSIGWFRFTNKWMARGIWATVVVSLLNTGVLYFKNGANQMGEPGKMPLEGVWRAEVQFPRGTLRHTVTERMDVFIAYDPVQMHYRGQSSIIDQRALGIEQLDEHKGHARVCLHLLRESGTNASEQFDAAVALAKNGRMLIFSEPNSASPFATMEK